MRDDKEEIAKRTKKTRAIQEESAAPPLESEEERAACTPIPLNKDHGIRIRQQSAGGFRGANWIYQDDARKSKEG